MNTGGEMVFLLKFQQLSLVLLFGRGVIPGTLRNYSRKKPQGGQIWHFWSLELDNQNISNFKPSLYATKKQTHGKYELELILQKQCIFLRNTMAPEQYQRHLAIFCSPIARITRLVKWKEAPASGSCAVHISPTHSVVCSLVKGYFQRD